MTKLTVLYTANLYADLNLLPRVFTQLQQVRQSYGVNPHPILLLDIGGAWSSDEWVSQVTEHRAPYLILDAMGYNVIHADGLNTGGILGLQGVVQARLLDATIAHTWERQDVQIYVGNKGPLPRISWVSEPATDDLFYVHQPQQLTLYQPVDAFGHLDVDFPSLDVLSAHYIAFDPNTRPDPTIVATIEYVVSEARAYAHKQQKENPSSS